MPTIIDGTAGITFPNSTVQASAGQVLQVVNATTTTTVTNSSNVYADTNLTATITPKFATSTILVIVNQSGIYKSAGNSQSGVDVRLLRNSTVIHQLATNYGYTNSLLVNIVGSANGSYIDSPATTSATTYKTQFRNNANAALVGVNDGAPSSSITLMEIAA
jgi:hypothetical protein